MHIASHKRKPFKTLSVELSPIDLGVSGMGGAQEDNGSQYVNEDSGVAMANEEYSLKPVNGIVQPPFIPPPNKPRRNTNQLQFISKVVLKAVMKHHFSWPFHHPVNAIELKLPDYHDIIKSPMDLTTIKKRLENCWYYSAKECQKDFITMFNNCYQYNKPGEDVVLMAEAIEKVYKTKIAAMPEPEVELPLPNLTSPGRGGKGKKGKGAGRPRGGGSAAAPAVVNASKSVPVTPNVTAPVSNVSNSVPSITNAVTSPAPPPKGTTAPLSVPGSTNMPTTPSVSPPTLRHSTYASSVEPPQPPSAPQKTPEDVKPLVNSSPGETVAAAVPAPTSKVGNCLMKAFSHFRNLVKEQDPLLNYNGFVSLIRFMDYFSET